MKFYNLFLIIFLNTLLLSCGGNTNAKKDAFLLKVDGKSNNFHLAAPLKAELVNKNNLEISNVTYFLNGIQLENTSDNNTKLITTIPSTTLLGQQKLSAKIKYSTTEEKEVAKNITIFNTTKPKIYSYEIVNTYPHDIKAYTQGLEFYNDTLYESTGQRGKSSLRKVNYKTGELYKKIDLNPSFFGEGITVLNNQLYMLTWRAGKGFIYDPITFEKKNTFNYGESKEGWGLCNDGKNIFKSDGTEKIWILDPNTLTETSYIQVCDNRNTYTKANELEYINGKIFANSYQNPSMMIINPKNGALEGVINFKGLKEKVTQHPNIDVLNGIAYNAKTETYFVTGKNWDKLFEVKLIEK